MAACSDPQATTTTETALACKVTHCEHDDCDRYDPKGDIVDAAQIPGRGAPSVVMPDVPLITRRVVLADGDELLAPVIPAWRTSADGRIALVDGTIRPVLLEQLATAPITKQPSDLAATIFGDGPGVGNFGDTATGGFLCSPDRAPPQPCDQVVPGGDPHHDCYSLVIGRRDDDLHIVKAGRLLVEVASPKTTGAAVTSIKIDGVHQVALPFGSSGEMVPTGDGHLVTLRIHGDAPGGAPIKYYLDKQRVQGPTTVSLAYAYAARACEIDDWFAQDGDVLAAIRPWPAAYADPRLHDQTGAPNYGIAARKLRDARGTELAQEDVLAGSYPWIDREGNNLMFSTVDPQPVSADHQTARYPMKLEAGGLDYVESAPRGFAVVGAWTQGKTILLDGMLNNEDYGFDANKTHQIALYAAADGLRGVRVNGGSNNGVPAALQRQNANGNDHEIESLENNVAMHAGARPVTPRDVVWTVTRGLASDEIAFDDFANPNVVLFAEMTASWAPAHDDHGQLVATNGTLLDGFPAHIESGPFAYDASAVRIQNAAASPVYALAGQGRIVGPGAGRIEPVALGGVRGRGLWLDRARLAFDLPDDARRAGLGFHVSVFVDARDRFDADPPQVFAFAPAGDAPAWSLALADGGGTAVLSVGATTRRIDLSCAVGSWAMRWHHLGVVFEGPQATLTLDGNRLPPVSLDAAASLAKGTLTFGGVRGWYDDARVEVDGNGLPLTTRPAPELLCNAAHGTVVRSGGQDTCATDYTRDLAVGPGYPPAGTVSRRGAILEGDAPLYWDQPRPASKQRGFCLTCHVDAHDDPGRAPKLTLDALAGGGSTPAYLDKRSQPMQPPAYGGQPPTVYGVIPHHWIGDAPAHDTIGPLPLLRWTLPHSP